MKILLLSRDEDYLVVLKDLRFFGDVTYFSNKLTEDIGKFDLIVCYCYGPILNQDQIDKLKGPIINLHPSFLPYGRGIYPILWGTALNHPLGSTIHLIENKEIDNGSIIIQEQFFFTKDITLSQAHLALTSLSRQLMLKLLCNGFPFVNIFETYQPNPKIAEQSYKNKKLSIKFFNLLPKGWSTTLSEVREIYNLYKDDI